MLAQLHGWKPEGTWFTQEDGSLRPWFGHDYASNSGQCVSRQDAHNLPAALERALAEQGATREQQTARMFPRWDRWSFGTVSGREGLKQEFGLGEYGLDRIVDALTQDWPGLSGEAALDLVAL